MYYISTKMSLATILNPVCVRMNTNMLCSSMLTMRYNHTFTLPLLVQYGELWDTLAQVKKSVTLGRAYVSRAVMKLVRTEHSNKDAPEILSECAPQVSVH